MKRPENTLSTQALQSLLQDALRALASGGILSPLTTWRGWRATRCHPAWHERLARIALAVGEGPATGAAARTATCADAARIIAAGYARLAADLAALPAPATTFAIRPLARGLPPHPAAARSIAGLQSYLERHCAADLRAAFVHGSHSTGDTTPYSDLDTLVILRAGAVIDAERLLGLARELAVSCRYLQRADVLQHHGHFVLTEIDLDWYCDAHFPSVLYAWATQVLGDDGLRIARQRDSAPEAREQLTGMCGRFTSPARPAMLATAFGLKLHLSCFMILPALLLQLRETPCYKRESFERVRSLYAPEDYRVMDEVSAMRRDWRQDEPGVIGHLASLHPVLRGALVQRRGRWGVPQPVFERVRNPAFQAQMARFARRTLELAGIEDVAA